MVVERDGNELTLTTNGASLEAHAPALRTLLPHALKPGDPLFAVWAPWSAAIAQSVQKANQDYGSILNKAVTEINSNIK